jgi:hypothetical protein
MGANVDVREVEVVDEMGRDEWRREGVEVDGLSVLKSDMTLERGRGVTLVRRDRMEADFPKEVESERV